jgi:hypothetical protein
MRKVEHVAHMTAMRIACRNFMRNLEEREYLEKLGINGRIIRNLNKCCGGLDSSDFG